MKQVAILGSGIVGQTLAGGFRKHGYGVVIGTNHPDKKIEWKDPVLKNVTVTSYEAAAQAAEMAVLAVKGSAAEDVVQAVAPHLAGKMVLDATNPIADAPPEKGVLQFFTTLEDSLLERLQKLAPQAHFVKAFSSVGSAGMVNPDFGGLRPTMFICGNHEPSKQEAAAILEQFGWDVADMGAADGARHRAAVHPVVHSRILEKPVDARLQAAEEVREPV